jgi:hypothetical protein
VDGGFLVVPVVLAVDCCRGWFLIVAHVLHAPSPLPVTAFPDAGSVLAYVFGLFVFIFFVHSFPL